MRVWAYSIKGGGILSSKKKISLWGLTWPIFIETLLFMLLGFIDTFMLSKFSDSAAASVGASNQVIMMFNLMFTIVSGATAVLVSQNLGAKNTGEVSKITALSFVMNLVLGAATSFFIVARVGYLLGAIGVSGQLYDYSRQYLLIVGGFLFLQALLNTSTAVMRSHGYTKESMYVTLVMNTINAVLDAVFIFGLFGAPVLGVKGVAMATSFSRLVGLLIMASILFRRIERPSIFKLVLPFPKKIFKDLLVIGIPSATESIIYNITQIILTGMILRHIGADDFTAKTYVQNIVMFFFVFSVAIGQGNQILVGHLVGGKNFDEADRSCMKSLKIALVISTVMSIIGFLFRFSLMRIFTENPYIIAVGGTILFIDIFVEFGRTFNVVVINGLRGAGDTVFPVVMAIISMGVMGLSLSYLFGIRMGMGLAGIWTAFAIDECFRGIVMLFRWKSGKWRSMSFVETVA